MTTWQDEFIETAKGYIGVDRQKNEYQISMFLALFDLPFQTVPGQPIPFCAAGVSWSACKAYCIINHIPFDPNNAVTVFKSVIGKVDFDHFKPSASCGVIRADAIQFNRYLTNQYTTTNNINILPGWLVMYNWDEEWNPEHVGIVLDAEDVLHTLEFNTSGTYEGSQIDGGGVFLKTRNYDEVVGFVKTF